jgi:hypothetical protein
LGKVRKWIAIAFFCFCSFWLFAFFNYTSGTGKAAPIAIVNYWFEKYATNGFLYLFAVKIGIKVGLGWYQEIDLFGIAFLLGALSSTWIISKGASLKKRITAIFLTGSAFGLMLGTMILTNDYREFWHTQVMNIQVGTPLGWFTNSDFFFSSLGLSIISALVLVRKD